MTIPEKGCISFYWGMMDLLKVSWPLFSPWGHLHAYRILSISHLIRFFSDCKKWIHLDFSPIHQCLCVSNLVSVIYFIRFMEMPLIQWVQSSNFSLLLDFYIMSVGPMTHLLCLLFSQLHQEHQWIHAGRKHSHHFLYSEQETRSLISAEAGDPVEHHVTTSSPSSLQGEENQSNIFRFAAHTRLNAAFTHLLKNICVNNSTIRYHSVRAKR